MKQPRWWILMKFIPLSFSNINSLSFTNPWSLRIQNTPSPCGHPNTLGNILNPPGRLHVMSFSSLSLLFWTLVNKSCVTTMYLIRIIILTYIPGSPKKTGHLYYYFHFILIEIQIWLFERINLKKKKNLKVTSKYWMFIIFIIISSWN